MAPRRVRAAGLTLSEAGEKFEMDLDDVEKFLADEQGGEALHFATGPLVGSCRS